MKHLLERIVFYSTMLVPGLLWLQRHAMLDILARQADAADCESCRQRRLLDIWTVEQRLRPWHNGLLFKEELVLARVLLHELPAPTDIVDR